MVVCHFTATVFRARIAVIAVESAVKYSFVFKGIQTRQKGQYNAELTFSPHLCVKPLITAIKAIVDVCLFQVVISHCCGKLIHPSIIHVRK